MPMWAVAETAVNSINALVARRGQEADPLLPEPLLPPPGCDPPLIVAGPGARPAAVGSCVHWARTGDSLDVALGAARRFQLTAIVAGPGGRPSPDQPRSPRRAQLARPPRAPGPRLPPPHHPPARRLRGEGR